MPETRTGFWDGEGQVPASMMFFHGLGFTVAGCAGSRAAPCASVSPWSSASAAPRLVESTRQCDTHVSLTPSCNPGSRELGEEAQGCQHSSGLPHLHPRPAPLPGTAMDLCIPGQVRSWAWTNVAQTAVRLHIPFNLWLGVINPPTKYPGSPVSVTPGEWSSFPGD